MSDAGNGVSQKRPTTVDGHQNNNSLFVVSCALVRRLDYTCRRRIVRQKDKKDFRADPNPQSGSEASKEFNEESDPDSIAREFAETKENFSEPIAHRDAEKQIKAQKNNSDANTRARRKSIGDSGGNACSRKKGLA